MPLSDDDKKLLQQEISILTQDQKDLLSSLKEARMELRTEVAERLAVHQKLVQELEIYKWVIRISRSIQIRRWEQRSRMALLGS